MITHIITFIVISLCKTDGSVVGDYNQLIFAQRSPIGSLIEEQSREVNLTVDDWITYVSEHLSSFDAQRWIVHGLWPMKLNAQSPTLCHTVSGILVRYENEELEADFKEELKFRWPSLSPNKTENELWETEYNVHGSCVSTSVEDYFTIAMQLSNTRNIGALLNRSQIYPGNEYSLRSIRRALENIIPTAIYIKCLPDQYNSEIQYLLEVHICLDHRFSLVDCHYSGDDCARKQLISYPGSPRTSL